jgi:excisionase family DNA binding protein
MTEKPNPTTSPWINVHEAAEYLDVCVDTIYDACAAGGLKHVRLGRRTIRLKREWLEAWAEAKARIAK